jgi:hypothetical protein
MSTDAYTPGCSTSSRAGPAPPTPAGFADRPDEFIAGVEQAALDPFRG